MSQSNAPGETKKRSINEAILVFQVDLAFSDSVMAQQPSWDRNAISLLRKLIEKEFTNSIMTQEVNKRLVGYGLMDKVTVTDVHVRAM